jgi:hypothetical protein
LGLKRLRDGRINFVFDGKLEIFKRRNIDIFRRRHGARKRRAEFGSVEPERVRTDQRAAEAEHPHPSHGVEDLASGPVYCRKAGAAKLCDEHGGATFEILPGLVMLCRGLKSSAQRVAVGTDVSVDGPVADPLTGVPILPVRKFLEERRSANVRNGTQTVHFQEVLIDRMGGQGKTHLMHTLRFWFV